MDFESAVKFLKSFNPYEDKGFPAYNEKNFNVERVRKFLKARKIGFSKLKYVHVTGSKGKSSVCMLTGQYLWKKVYKVGVFTNPYIMDVRECFWMNGKNISKKEFVERVLELKKFVKKYKGLELTYFELLVVLILEYFVDGGVDFVVMEVGLGGRLDATNVVSADVAVLTTVEKEHTEILGKTYEKILNEKLGIVVGKNVKNLVVGWQMPSVKKLVEKKTKGVKNVIFVKENDNGKMVFEIVKMLLGKVDEKLLAKIVADFKMIGRLDLRIIKGKTVVFDMAHTEKSILRLLDFLKVNFKNKKWNFLVSIMKNKNVKSILQPIYKVADKIIVTSSVTERGFKARELEGLAREIGLNVLVFENGKEAYLSLLKKMGRSDVLVVTGSHFLVGDILKTL
jgi:dihydrofolate synthase/folylpolyglutamate synthase